jgi:uncharacterized membrane protein YphA (DoxX/SURF4 family)
MKLQLPTRMAASLGVAITALITLAQETHWSHEVKQGVIIAGGLLLAWVVHPTEGGVQAPETARKPEGATPAQPPPGI